mgnify:CR=1 FL=1
MMSFKILKKITIIPILLTFLCVYNINANEVNIVAKVKNEIITSTDINNEINYLLALNNEMKDLNKNTIYELAKRSMVNEIVKKQELLKYFDFSKNTEVFEGLFVNFFQTMNFNNEEDFADYLKSFDLKISDVKKKIQIETLWNELIYGKYKSKVNIDIEKIKNELNAAKTQEKTLEYLLSEIVFKINKIDELEKTYNEISENIKNVGFKNTANIYSISSTAKLGGNIGWIQENQLSEEIKKIVKTLDIDEWSEPIKVSNGFLILKLSEKKIINKDVNPEEALKKIIKYRTDKQLTQYSLIYFNKIKYNQLENE